MGSASLSLLLSSSVAAALLLATSWLGAALWRHGTAAARHQIWTLGVAGVLLFPLVCWALPSLLLPRALSFSLETPVSASGRSLLTSTVLSASEPTTSAGLGWSTWLTLAWATAALLVSLRLARGYLAAHRLWRTAEPARAATWRSAQREAAVALGITRDVALRRSEAIGSPMTIGVLRPRVLLPAAADAWSPPRLHAVLIHELGHVRRNDPLIQLGAQLVCALHWWNPLAWLAAARLRIEREHACDDLVLGAGIRPSSYAADLLEVARLVSRGTAPTASAACMVDPSGTEARLRRVLDEAAPREPLGGWFRTATRSTALAVTMALACTSETVTRPPPSRPAPTLASEAGGADAGTTPHERARLGLLSLGAPLVRKIEDGERTAPPAFLEDDVIDIWLVTAEIERNLGGLEACYEQRLLARSGLSGEVTIHWGLTANGEIAEQCITKDAIGDPEILACVNQLIATSQFPAPTDGPVDIELPFVFTARGLVP